VDSEWWHGEKRWDQRKCFKAHRYASPMSPATWRAAWWQNSLCIWHRDATSQKMGNLVLSCSYMWLWRNTNLTERGMAVPHQNIAPPSQDLRWSSSSVACHSLVKLPDPPNACKQHVHVIQHTTLGEKQFCNFWYTVKILVFCNETLQHWASASWCFKGVFNGHLNPWR
jgi:hypothetical protein